MARYTDKKSLDKHHFTAMAKMFRHYSERFDSIANQMQERSIHVMDVTHFKSMTDGMEKIQRFLNAALAAHEEHLLDEVKGEDFMTAAAAKDRFPADAKKPSKPNVKEIRKEADHALNEKKGAVPNETSETKPQTRRKKHSR